MLQKVNNWQKILKINRKYAEEHIVRKFARKDKPFIMGMAASQGRLLFMTARISNNEFEQQCVAQSKQRLADASQTANDQYLEALQATQYQLITGFNGDTPNYEPVTYNQLTALNSVAARKQYVVSDNKGQILVTKAIAEAFGDAHNDFNTFLKKVGGLTQVEKATVTEADVHDAWDKYFTSINKGDVDGIYYDKNLTSEHVLGFSFHETNNGDVVYATYNTVHMFGGAGNKIYLQEDNGNYKYTNYKIEIETCVDEYGEKTYKTKYKPSHWDEDMVDLMNDEGYIYLEPQYCYAQEDPNDGNKVKIRWCAGGATEDHPENYPWAEVDLYVDQDYARYNSGTLTHPYITDSYLGKPANEKGIDRTKTIVESEQKTIFYEGTTAEQRELYDYAIAVTEKFATGNKNKLEYDADKIQYYKNIYQQMITNGFTTFDKMLEEKYINTISYDTSGNTKSVNDENQAYKNDEWLITLLKNGKLNISFYDSTVQGFVGTTLDDDESIVEKENKSKMAIAEQVYQSHMDRIESEDKRFDMQLTKLESEHQALTTEYDSVAKVISKNVEKSFNTFNA